MEVLPGLRAAVAATRHADITERALNLMAFLSDMHTPFDVIDIN
jgi:hypothetical protein